MHMKRSFTAAVIILALAASVGPWPAPLATTAHAAHAGSTGAPWPPAWQDTQPPRSDFTPPRFEAPSAAHCQRAPTTREVAGVDDRQQVVRSRGIGRESDVAASTAIRMPPDARGELIAKLTRPFAPAAAVSAAAAAPMSLGAESDKTRSGEGLFVPPTAPRSEAPQVTPPSRQREANQAVVTAGVVDDNADFGEYLAYRSRNAGQPVRERDISERYLLEVTDNQGRPVHDAEVAVQSPGVTVPVMWARTDTAGRVWLHPRAFMATDNQGDLGSLGSLGIAVRKDGQQARATLLRGQSQAVQIRLGEQSQVKRPRLDLVFMVDATGSMGDEIGKLKASMRAMADQIAQLPGQPDICYGLVAYRDRGDAFITRTHDLTDDLSAFQNLLSRVQAQGGGDTPEALNEALHEVVHGLSWRASAARLVVLVADAPPHLDYGGPQYDIDMQAALAKGIKLFAVGASGLDPVGEYIFRQIAQYTAGRFVFLTYKNAAHPASGPGTQTVHDVKNYSVQTLDKLVVRLVGEELARLVKS